MNAILNQPKFACTNSTPNVKIMETANGYIDNHLMNSAMNKHPSFQQQLQSSTHQQCFNQINQINQLNQLNYIDDDYQQQPNNPPYYADLKVNDDLQRLHIDDGQSIEPIKHWSKLIYDCMEIQLFEWNIAGGSDYGQLSRLLSLNRI